MARLKQRTIYLVEGETEKTLIKALSQTEIPPGKIFIFNIWNHPINRLARKLGKPKEFHLSLVIDTDTTCNWPVFRDNILFLNDRSYNYGIYVQHHNLEDELVYCCHKNAITSLTRDFYQLSSVTEFKTRFAQDKNLNATLQKNQFDFFKLWKRPHSFEQCCIQQHIKAHLCNT